MGVVIELPGISPILILIAPVDGQVSSLIRTEVLVLSLHTLEGRFKALIAPRASPRRSSIAIDPSLKTLMDRDRVI